MAASKISPEMLAMVATIQSAPTAQERLDRARTAADNPMAAHLLATWSTDGTTLDESLLTDRVVKGKITKRDDEGNVLERTEDREIWVGTAREMKVNANAAKAVHDLIRRAAAAQKVGSTVNFLDKDGVAIVRPAIPGFKAEEGVKRLQGNTTVYVVFAAKEKSDRSRDNDAEIDDEDDDDGDDEPTGENE